MQTLWNTELLQKWVDALRSGKYPMGYGRLAPRDDEGNESYCCLGVACEVAGLRKWVNVDSEMHTYGNVVYASAPDGWPFESATVLPPGFELPYGGDSKGYLCLNVNDHTGWDTVATPYGGSVTLTECNDSMEFTQMQLADVIEFFFLNPSRQVDSALSV